MFKIIQNGVNRLDIELSGKVNAKEIRAVLDELALKSENITNGTMVYDVIEFHMPSPAAIAIEFSRLPSLFRIIRRFKRAAVLTDREWIKTFSEFEGALIPGLEIKAFERFQKEEAEAWLAK